MTTWLATVCVCVLLAAVCVHHGTCTLTTPAPPKEHPCPIKQCSCTHEVGPVSIETTLYCIDQPGIEMNLPSLPANNSVTILDLSRNHMRSLPTKWLVNLNSSLEKLYLDTNSLLEIPEGVLWLANLQELSMKNNSLTLESDGPLFEHMVNLEILSLKNNMISNLAVNVFNEMRHLQGLDLSANRLTFISNDVFTDLVSVYSLDLSYNQISQLGRGNFMALRNLFYLDLSHNKLTVIDKYAFSGLTQLYTLDLRYNYIADLPSDLFKPCYYLNEVDLSDNSLSSLPEDLFEPCLYLEKVSLFNNSLAELPPALFSTVAPSLLELYLGHNNYTSLSPEFFSNMNKLRMLSLWGSPLSAAPNMSALSQLYFLSLSGTRVSTVYPCDVADLRSLHILKWWRAPIACDCHVRWLREWFDDELDPETRTEIVTYYPWTCASPPHRKGLVFHELQPENFTCPGLEQPLWCHPDHHLVRHLSLEVTVLEVTDTEVNFQYETDLTDAVSVVYQRLSWHDLNTTYSEAGAVSDRQLPTPGVTITLKQLAPDSVYSVCVHLYGAEDVQVLANCTHVRTHHTGAYAWYHRSSTAIRIGVLLPCCLLVCVILASVYLCVRPPACRHRRRGFPCCCLQRAEPAAQGFANTVYDASGEGSVHFQQEVGKPSDTTA